MTSLVRARDFYYQEAAIVWLFSSPEERFYIAYHLASVLKMKSDHWLGFMKISFLVSRVKLSGVLHKRIFFPLDLMVRMIDCELEHRAVDRSHIRRFQGECLEVIMENATDAVIGTGFIEPKSRLWN